MKLVEKQKIFSKNVAKLILYIFDCGYSCTLGEAYRTPKQAELNAKAGIGITNSLHCSRLAIDLYLFSPAGEYLTKSEDYEKFGNYWKGLNPDNRWGGDFKGLPDGNHFSLTPDQIRA